MKYGWRKPLGWKRGVRRAFGYVGSKVRYDGASFFGAVLCLMSLFIPWVSRSYPYGWGRHPFWWNLKTEWFFSDLLQDPDFVIVLGLFLVGTIASLFFKWGVALQAVGLVGFLMVAPGHFIPLLPSKSMTSWGLNYQFGLGYFLAFAGVTISAFLARNFWWQRSSSRVVPSVSRFAALAPKSTRVLK